MRVRVLGGGIVGLVVAEELQRRGHEVVVVDPAPVSGASYAAAGMLSPAAEVWYGEEELLRLGAESLAAWPALAARLGVELRSGGTLLVGHDGGDAQLVDRQVELLTRHGAEVEEIDRRALRDAEPGIARVVRAVRLPAEASVNPREVCAALLRRVGVVAGPDDGPGDSPGAAAVDVTVVATGARLPEPWSGLVRPVRGEILRLRSDDPPTGTVRGWVGGEPVYLVSRADGEVVVGATMEEHDGPPVVSAGGVWRILSAARVIWPALDRAELLETVARDRPGTTDGLPLIGPVSTGSTNGAHVVLAAGHFRHGVLLAPLTARLVADHLEHGTVDPAVDPRRLTADRILGGSR